MGASNALDRSVVRTLATSSKRALASNSRWLRYRCYEGTAWVGVVPFRMEKTRLRGLPPLPGTDRFPEANVRTSVTEAKSGHPVFSFFRSTQRIRWPLQEHARESIAVFFRQDEHRRRSGGRWRYPQTAIFVRARFVLRSTYRSCGREKTLPPAKPGSIEYFLTERYALFTRSGGR